MKGRKILGSQGAEKKDLGTSDLRIVMAISTGNIGQIVCFFAGLSWQEPTRLTRVGMLFEMLILILCQIISLYSVGMQCC